MKKYKTEEERKTAQREANKRWREKNKDKIAEYQIEYYKKNKNKTLEYYKKNKKRLSKYVSDWWSNERKNNKKARAKMHVDNYKRVDKLYNRGECTLTPQWIVDNIFSQPCHYCGETDWRKIGCDRIDNTKPHTQDNVIPCCSKCNRKRGRNTYDEFMKMIGNNNGGEL